MIYLFVDTEFCSFEAMELLSIGIVSEDGKHEFYAEVNDYTPENRSQFVIDNIMPLMEPAKYGRSYARVASDLSFWLESLPVDDIEVVVDYSGDWMLMKQLLSVRPPIKNIRAIFIAAAFEDMLIERGVASPEVQKSAMRRMVSATVGYFNIDPRQHHALVDAKANREGWVRGYEWAVKKDTV